MVILLRANVFFYFKTTKDLNGNLFEIENSASAFPSIMTRLMTKHQKMTSQSFKASFLIIRSTQPLIHKYAQ